MIAADKYQKAAADLRAKARKESSEHAKAELESLAVCYSIKAQWSRGSIHGNAAPLNSTRGSGNRKRR